MNHIKRFIGCIAGLAVALGFGLAQAAPITVTTSPAAPPPAAAPAVVPAAARLDINAASADQLATLPGIGAVRSASIVSGRPYKRKDDLVKRKIIPLSVYTKIKDQIIATQE